MQLAELSARALRIRDLYDEINRKKRGRTWTREEFMLGFMGDVGDLAKLVAAAEGGRDVPPGRNPLGHELADCLWAVLVLANSYDIDLETEFQTTMDELESGIKSDQNGSGS